MVTMIAVAGCLDAATSARWPPGRLEPRRPFCE